jgi:hypothetical protein
VSVAFQSDTATLRVGVTCASEPNAQKKDCPNTVRGIILELMDCTCTDVVLGYLHQLGKEGRFCCSVIHTDGLRVVGARRDP